MHEISIYINFIVCVFIGKLNLVTSPDDRKLMDMTGVFSVKIINTVAGVPLFLPECRICTGTAITIMTFWLSCSFLSFLLLFTLSLCIFLLVGSYFSGPFIDLSFLLSILCVHIRCIFRWCSAQGTKECRRIFTYFVIT